MTAGCRDPAARKMALQSYRTLQPFTYSYRQNNNTTFHRLSLSPFNTFPLLVIGFQPEMIEQHGNRRR